MGSLVRITVVGLGLIGGSILQTSSGGTTTKRTRGWDVDPGTRLAARSAGFDVPETLDEALVGAQIVVLAVPLRVMGSTAASVAALIDDDVIVMDAGSVKGPVREAVVAAGVRRFVGAHPMAGTEDSGFGAAHADLLPGARWAVTVDPSTDTDALRAVLRWITATLGGEVTVMTDDDHDAAVALVSHVPHVVATELLRGVGRSPVAEVALGLAAGSFRDGTRVGRTDPRKTEAMVMGNAVAVAESLRAIARNLDDLAAHLEATASASTGDGHADAVRVFFDEPAPVRAALASSGGVGAVRTEQFASASDVARLIDIGYTGGVIIGVGDDVVQVRSGSVVV